ncbi:hypothetical protein [Candidatus Nitrospira allomarina]|jgi:hypothetical protein|uniref:Uncharacterized protein n=1 Tax=Candidatus Nitrospira allomarina TaxID=3020900 RepID=A0AA96JSN5_9BACT|nr:hypothetical protein [Candidatus Nitrospira allomarina]WNM58275.1 hypothetical protein PP769_00515 [Candidatus Nitrospira allomarina]
MTFSLAHCIRFSIRGALVLLWVLAFHSTLNAKAEELPDEEPEFCKPRLGISQPEDSSSDSDEAARLSDSDLEAINEGVQWLVAQLKARSPDPVALGEPITLVNGETYFSLEGSQLDKCYEYLRGYPVSGLRGFTRRMSENGYFHAIYVNADYIGHPDDEGSLHKRNEVIHTTIHEAIHLNSFNQKGFWGGESDTEWTFPSNENPDPDRYFLLLDEGTTEMFARMVLYHVMEKNGIGTVIVDRDPDNDDWLPIPIYEYPKNLACALVWNKEIGIQKWANAYFLGEWKDAAFGLRMATEVTWDHVRKLGVNSSSYQKNGDSYREVNSLREQYGKLSPEFFVPVEETSVRYTPLPLAPLAFDCAKIIERR